MMKRTLSREKLWYVLIMFNYLIRNYVLMKNNENFYYIFRIRVSLLLVIYALAHELTGNNTDLIILDIVNKHIFNISS